MKAYNHLWLLLILPFFLIACKKGEDDPLLSFRSRNSRLIGVWKLEERKLELCDWYGERKFNYLVERKSNIESYYDDGELIGSSDVAPVTLEILEDGSYEIIVDEKIDIFRPNKFSGMWSWEDSKKNKDAISIDNYFLIVKLSNNELILERFTETSYITSDDQLYTSLLTESRIYEKVK